MNWEFLFYLGGLALMAWLAIRMIKKNPDAFSRENLSKSITTVGILALLMIGFIAVCIVLLKHL